VIHTSGFPLEDGDEVFSYFVNCVLNYKCKSYILVINNVNFLILIGIVSKPAVGFRIFPL